MGDVVTVPEKYGLGSIEVTAITDGAVEMVAPLTGSGYSLSGCAGGGGGVALIYDEGTVVTVNG